MGSSGHGNLVPGAASKVKPRRDLGVGSATYLHMRFVVWAMQVKDIDSLTVKRIRYVMRVSTATAQRLRSLWRHMTSTRMYHDSVPDIVGTLEDVYHLSKPEPEEEGA